MANDLRDIDLYFLKKEEPLKSYLLALRNHILEFDHNISEAWKYKMPFYCYRNKMLCYLWIHKKFHQPYLGIVDGKQIQHPALLLEKRAKMKILLFDPLKNIPVRTVNQILAKAISLRS
jgi:hypothetical protein